MADYLHCLKCWNHASGFSSVCRALTVQQKEKTKPRPLPLNTVEMLRMASSGLNIGPQHTMQIAERLYIQV